MFPTEILVDIHPLVNTSILSTITYQLPFHLSAQRYRERSAATWSPLKTSGFTPSNVSTANSHTASISNQQSISELLDIIYPYLIFVSFFTRTHFESWKFYTRKVRKSPTNLPKTVIFSFFLEFITLSQKFYTHGVTGVPDKYQVCLKLLNVFREPPRPWP